MDTTIANTEHLKMETAWSTHMIRTTEDTEHENKLQKLDSIQYFHV